MEKALFTILYLIVNIAALAAIDPPQNLRADYNTEPLGIDNPTPAFSWIVGDRSRGAMQSAYQLLVSTSAEKLAQNEGDAWDTEKVNSDQTFQVIYAGKPLHPSTRYYWKVRTWNGEGQPSTYSDVSWFETGLLSPDDWQAEWIYAGSTPPERDEDFYQNIPSPLFRKAFDLNKAISSARLYISGLGYYEAYLNGEKIGDHYLDPGWTQYAETVYYSAFDVTEALQNGENVLGVMLGNGWYNPLPMRLFSRFNLREILTIGQPKLIAQLQVTYADGSSETINSDTSWKTTDGPILRNNVYLGEWYDARREKEGWREPDYRDNDWEKVRKAEAPAGELKWQYIPPIRHTRSVHPVAIDEPQEGVYIVDMGQNFAGLIRFRAQAPEGTEIRFRYSELLYNDGLPDFRTTAAAQIKEGGLSGGPGAPTTAWQEDRYICKGEGTEIFEPRFTFHGFRYVEITGLPYKPSLNDIEGLRLNSDLPDAASFRCSNELFNRVQDITEWTMLSNVFSIESDCPAREKFGYGGDMVTAGETYIYNYDMANFYTKTVRDFERDARPNGSMPECAPDIGINIGGVDDGAGPPGWTLAHPFLLDRLYKYYGDKRLVEQSYQPLKDLVEFYRERVPDHIIMDGIGDHVSIDERPTPVTSTAFYYHHAKILSDLAGVLGKGDDQQTYGQLANEIKQAFIDEFVNRETGEVYTATQAAQVFALYYNLLPDDRQVRQKVTDVLMDEIYLEHQGHVSTGIFSTKMMLEYLSEVGRSDVVYDMLNKKEFPGYGYMVDNGATTLWENWTFKENDSKNHPMFGSVSEWFHKYVLGIRQTPESVAFEEIIIKPAIIGGLEWAEGHYESIRGRIGSKWWKFGDDQHVEVEIPANTKAFIYLPLDRLQDRPTIYERDTLLVDRGEVMTEGVDDTMQVSRQGSYYVVEVGGGKYDFVVR